MAQLYMHYILNGPINNIFYFFCVFKYLSSIFRGPTSCEQMVATSSCTQLIGPKYICIYKQRSQAAKWPKKHNFKVYKIYFSGIVCIKNRWGNFEEKIRPLQPKLVYRPLGNALWTDRHLDNYIYWFITITVFYCTHIIKYTITAISAEPWAT